MGVAGFGHGAVSGDGLVGCCHQQVGGIARGLVHTRYLKDEEPRPAFCPGPVIGNQPLADQPAGRQVGIVARRKYPVLDGDAAQGERREQFGEAGIGHGNLDSRNCRASGAESPPAGS